MKTVVLYVAWYDFFYMNGEYENAYNRIMNHNFHPQEDGEDKLIENLDNDIYYVLGYLYEDEKKRERVFQLAAKGKFELTSAMYYNDRPPEMMYYALKGFEINKCHAGFKGI